MLGSPQAINVKIMIRKKIFFIEIENKKVLEKWSPKIRVYNFCST